jgi:hypothetical protein
MTITCILADKSKVAAHDAIDKRVRPQIIYAIKSRVTALNKGKVERVIAAGAGSCWTPFLQSQRELWEGLKKNSPNLAKLTDMQALYQCAPFLISGSQENKNKFLDILKRDLGAAQTSYTNYDFGRIQITAGGELDLG